MAADPAYSLRQEVPPERLSGRPYLRDDGEQLALHFDFRTVQSSMSKADPTALTLGYTRAMMGFLLLQPEPRHIAMIGLGGGSLVRYCRHHLPQAEFTAVEIDPAIIALREEFRLPPDGEHFRILCADGADYVRQPGAPVDALLLDGFGLDGLPRQLCSTAFYDYCYARLAPGGVLVANLWSGDDMLPVYLGRLRQCFEGRVVLIDVQEEGNHVVFACRPGERAGLPTPFPPHAQELRQQAARLAPRHPVDLPDIAERLCRALERHKRRRRA